MEEKNPFLDLPKRKDKNPFMDLPKKKSWGGPGRDRVSSAVQLPELTDDERRLASMAQSSAVRSDAGDPRIRPSAKGRAAVNEAQARLTKAVEPYAGLLSPAGELARLGGGKNPAAEMAVGAATTPLNVAAEVDTVMDPRENTNTRVRAGLNIARDVIPLEVGPAAKAAVSAAAKRGAKAGPIAKAVQEVAGTLGTRAARTAEEVARPAITGAEKAAPKPDIGTVRGVDPATLKRRPKPKIDAQLVFNRAKNAYELPPMTKAGQTAEQYVAQKWRAKVQSDIRDIDAMLKGEGGLAPDKSEARKLGFIKRQAEAMLKSGKPSEALAKELADEHAAIIAQETPVAAAPVPTPAAKRRTPGAPKPKVPTEPKPNTYRLRRPSDVIPEPSAASGAQRLGAARNPMGESVQAVGAEPIRVDDAGRAAPIVDVVPTIRRPNNAIQEPAATSGVLRQERPEVGLRQVGEGNPQVQTAPEVIPQAKAQEVAPKFATSNLATGEQRAAAGLEPVERQRIVVDEPYNYDAVMASARRNLDLVASGQPPMPQSRAAEANYTNAFVEVDKRIHDAEEAAARAADQGLDASAHLEAAAQARKDLDDLSRASTYVGSETARALVQRNLARSRQNTNAGLYNYGTSKLIGIRKLGDKETEAIKRLSDQINTQKHTIIALESKIAAAEARKTVATMRSAATRGSVEAIRQRRTSALASLQKNVTSTQLGAGLDPAQLGAIARDVMEIARTYVDEGVVRLEDLVARIKADASDAGADLDDTDILRILGGEYAKTSKPLSKTAETLRELKKQARMSEPTQKAALDRRIAKLESDLAKGEGRAGPAQKRVTPFEKELQDERVRLRALEIQADEMRYAWELEAAKANDPLAAAIASSSGVKRGALKAVDAARHVPEVARGLVATADFSAPLNQGAFVAAARPLVWARGVKTMVNASKNPEALRMMQGAIRDSRRYDQAKASGLAIGRTGLPEGMENMAGPLVERIPGFGKVAAISDRAYTAFLEKVRMDMFENIMDSMERPWMGIAGVEKVTPQEAKAIADYVNNATGRGTGWAAEGFNKLNPRGLVLFSPSYMVSRWQLAMGSPVLRRAVLSNPKLAAIIMKDYLQAVGVVGGSLYGLKESGIADAELDSRSSDFGKVRIANTTVDPWGGMLTPYRLLTQMSAGIKDAKGKVRPPSMETSAGYYAFGKAAPLPRAAIAIKKGESFGKSFDLRTPEGVGNLARSFLPISVQTGLDIGQEAKLTPEQKFALGLIAIFGANVNVKGESLPTNRS